MLSIPSLLKCRSAGQNAMLSMYDLVFRAKFLGLTKIGSKIEWGDPILVPILHKIPLLSGNLLVTSRTELVASYYF